MLASPFVRTEIRDLMLDRYRQRGRTLLEGVAALGGEGLGGRYGRYLEERFERLIGDTDITELDLKKNVDQWVDEMLQAGIYPLPVMPGVMCMKPTHASGACARSSKDRAADAARCSPRCPFQVQEANRREVAIWTLRKMAAGWTAWSTLQQGFWALGAKSLVLAWPDVADELEDAIAKWPILKEVLYGGKRS
jgi:hypothetical protein